MTALARTKTGPDNPLRGMINDACAVLGIDNPEDFLGTPADLAKDLGIPTIKDAVPSPADVGHSAVGSMRGGGGFKFPQANEFMPPPPERMFGQFPMPFGQRGSYYQDTSDKRDRRRP